MKVTEISLAIVKLSEDTADKDLQQYLRVNSDDLFKSKGAPLLAILRRVGLENPKHVVRTREIMTAIKALVNWI